MSKINWLHISDLHFGAEKEFGSDVVNIRADLIAFLNNLSNIDFKYLFITGDIFYAPVFHFANLEDQEKLVAGAAKFINQLIDKLKIDKKDVFIVPGNHDTDRRNGEKAKYIQTIYKTYTEKEEINPEMVKKLQTFQEKFNSLCKQLGDINYCDYIHKLVQRTDADILMLNTSFSSCIKEETAKLLLGANLFENEINQYEFKDEAHPLFILAHHKPECFSLPERANFRSLLEKKKKDSALYLCGHDHVSQASDSSSDGIPIVVCGTNVRREKREGGETDTHFQINEVNFLTGSFDTTLGEIKIFFYKWSYTLKRWIENREIQDNVPFPYNAKIIKTDDYKKDLLNATSESVAFDRFFNYLLNRLKEKSINKFDDEISRCNYFKSEVSSLLELLTSKKSEWGCFHKLKNGLYTTLNNIEGDLTTLIEAVQKEHREFIDAKERINEKIEEFKRIIWNDAKSKSKKGILLYSKSTQVTDFLKALTPIDIRKNCVIYICAGEARGDKDSIRFKDGLDISRELYDTNSGNFRDFQIKIVPDIVVDSLFEQKKINVVLFGAHKIYFGRTCYTHFSNTVGSGLIKNLAIRKEIPCFIVADQSKKASNPNPDIVFEKLKIFNFEKYNSDFGKKINVEYLESELVNIQNDSNLIYVISDKDTPWDGYKFITSEAVSLFLNKILKDRRELIFNDDTKDTITKKYLSPIEGEIEYETISALNNENIKSAPKIISKQSETESITLKYYKGIRVFNLLVIIDLLKNQYGIDSQQAKDLNSIVESLLKNCEQNQKNIQKILCSKFKNHRNIEIYPKDKLTDIVELFFMCFKLDSIDKQSVLAELENVYNEFSRCATVPFRDASTKNMILDAEQLYLEKFQNDDKKRVNEIRRLFEMGELKKIVDSNIIDIDFSSCIHFTTPFDDVISFKFHHRTAPYFLFEKFDIWDENIDINNSGKAIAATFIMRFLRFGGRKVLYKVIDPLHHDTRFRYDNEVYYFKVLPQILKFYWNNAETELKETLKLFKRIEEILISSEELPSIASDDTVVLRQVEEIIKKKTYLDVYPY